MNPSTLQSTFYALGSLCLIIICMIYGEFILVPIAYSIIFATLLSPLLKRVKRVIKNHTAAYITTILGLIIILFFPIYFIFSQVSALFAEINNSRLEPENITDTVVTTLREKDLYFPNLFDQFTSDLSGTVSWISSTVGSMLIDSSTFVIYIGLAIIFAYFLTSYYDDLKRIVFAELERKQKIKWQEILVESPDIVRSYLRGMLIVMFILAVLNGLIFFLIGLKYAIIWGIIIGLLAIIPYVGSIIGLMLPLAYSLLNSDGLAQPFTIIICFLAIQSIEGNFLTPKIVGDKIDVNPMIIIILMLAFGKIWGVAGILICLPLAGIIRVIMSQWRKSEFIAKIMESK